MTKGIDMQPQLAEQVRSFVVATFLWDRPDRLRDEDSFLEQGIMDSTGVLELISWIEETYGVEVGDGELVPENFDSINNVAAYVATKLNRKPESFGRCESANQ